MKNQTVILEQINKLLLCENISHTQSTLAQILFLMYIFYYLMSIVHAIIQVYAWPNLFFDACDNPSDLKTIAIMTSQTQNFLIFWLLILDSKSFQIIF